MMRVMMMLFNFSLYETVGDVALRFTRKNSAIAHLVIHIKCLKKSVCGRCFTL